MALNCPNQNAELDEGCADFDWFEANVYGPLDAIVDKINVHLAAEGTATIGYITRPNPGDCADLAEIERVETFLDTLFATGRLPKYAWDENNPGQPFPDPTNPAEVQQWVDCGAYWTDLPEVRACLSVPAPGAILSETGCLSLSPANVFYKILQCLATGGCFPTCECPECVAGNVEYQHCSDPVTFPALVVVADLGVVIEVLGECYYNVGVTQDPLTVPAPVVQAAFDSCVECETPNYNYRHCSDYVTFPNLVFAAHVGVVVKVDGECYEYLNRTANLPTVPAPVIQAVYPNCVECEANCWLLTDCYDSNNTLIVSNDLQNQFDNAKIILYEGVCYEVTEPHVCDDPTLMADFVEYVDCPTCPANVIAKECIQVWKYRDPVNYQTPSSIEYVDPQSTRSVVRSSEYVNPKSTVGGRYSVEYREAFNDQTHEESTEYREATNDQTYEKSVEYRDANYDQTGYTFSWEYVVAINPDPGPSWLYEESAYVGQDFSWRYEPSEMDTQTDLSWRYEEFTNSVPTLNYRYEKVLEVTNEQHLNYRYEPVLEHANAQPLNYRYEPAQTP